MNQLVASTAIYLLEVPSPNTFESTAFAEPPSIASSVLGHIFMSCPASSFIIKISNPATAVGNLTPSPSLPTVVTLFISLVRAVAPA